MYYSEDPINIYLGLNQIINIKKRAAILFCNSFLGFNLLIVRNYRIVTIEMPLQCIGHSINIKFINLIFCCIEISLIMASSIDSP